MLVPYRATDRRCYNGAYCSDLQKEIDHTVSLLNLMKKECHDSSCTYFPEEGKYMVFVKHKPLTDKFHENKQEAIIEAIHILR